LTPAEAEGMAWGLAVTKPRYWKIKSSIFKVINKETPTVFAGGIPEKPILDCH